MSVSRKIEIALKNRIQGNVHKGATLIENGDPYYILDASRSELEFKWSQPLLANSPSRLLIINGRMERARPRHVRSETA